MTAPGGLAVSDRESLLEVRIDSIAAGGDGVARDDRGRVVFVPRTAPGDRVEVRIVKEKKTWARALPIRTLVRSSDHIQPPCPYARTCGGCQLQHLSDAAQRTAHRKVVADALARIGGVEVDVSEPLRVGPAFGYRNRVTFTLRRTADGVHAGYHRFDDPGRLVDVKDCPLAEPSVRRAWTSLRETWGPSARALPEGRELRLTLRCTHGGGVGLLVEGGESGRHRAGDPARLESGVPNLESYHWRDGARKRHPLAGAETLSDRWGGIDLRLRPDAFVQVNRSAAQRVDEWVDRLIGPAASRRLLDLYAGAGTRALRWALAGGEAVACEANADAVETGREAAVRCSVDVRFLKSRVGAELDALLPADIVVVNPPRQGLSRRVAERLAQGGARGLAYVSCDPATLARDLGRLRSSWNVTSVQPFHAFPQTSHVETLAWLEPTGGSV